MTKRTKGLSKPVSMPAGIGLGAFVALVWAVIGAAVVAKLVDSEALDFERVGYASMGIQLTASALAAFIAYRKIGKYRAPVCLGAGAAYFLCLASMTALFFGGRFSGVGVTVALVLLGSGMVALAGLRNRGGKSVKRYRVPMY